MFIFGIHSSKKSNNDETVYSFDQVTLQVTCIEMSKQLNYSFWTGIKFLPQNFLRKESESSRQVKTSVEDLLLANYRSRIIFKYNSIFKIKDLNFKF